MSGDLFAFPPPLKASARLAEARRPVLSGARRRLGGRVASAVFSFNVDMEGGFPRAALCAKFLHKGELREENRMSRDSQTAGMMAIIAALLVPS